MGRIADVRSGTSWISLGQRPYTAERLRLKHSPTSQSVTLAWPTWIFTARYFRSMFRYLVMENSRLFIPVAQTILGQINCLTGTQWRRFLYLTSSKFRVHIWGIMPRYLPLVESNEYELWSNMRSEFTFDNHLFQLHHKHQYTPPKISNLQRYVDVTKQLGVRIRQCLSNISLRIQDSRSCAKRPLLSACPWPPTNSRSSLMSKARIFYKKKMKLKTQ